MPSYSLPLLLLDVLFAPQTRSGRGRVLWNSISSGLPCLSIGFLPSLRQEGDDLVPALFGRLALGIDDDFGEVKVRMMFDEMLMRIEAVESAVARTLSQYPNRFIEIGSWEQQ